MIRESIYSLNSWRLFGSRRSMVWVWLLGPGSIYGSKMDNMWCLGNFIVMWCVVGLFRMVRSVGFTFFR